MNKVVDESDYEVIKSWGAKRMIEYNHFPPIGFINPHACCFLIETTGSFCLAELLVTNPESNKAERDEAIVSLSADIKKTAKELGYKKIIVITKFPSVAKRAFNEGCSELFEYVVLERAM